MRAYISENWTRFSTGSCSASASWRSIPRVDFEEHKQRFLQAIAKLYRAHPERFGIVKVWRPKVEHRGSLAPPLMAQR